MARERSLDTLPDTRAKGSNAATGRDGERTARDLARSEQHGVCLEHDLFDHLDRVNSFGSLGFDRFGANSVCVDDLRLNCFVRLGVGRLGLDGLDMIRCRLGLSRLHGSRLDCRRLFGQLRHRSRPPLGAAWLRAGAILVVQGTGHASNDRRLRQATSRDLR